MKNKRAGFLLLIILLTTIGITPLLPVNTEAGAPQAQEHLLIEVNDPPPPAPIIFNDTDDYIRIDNGLTFIIEFYKDSAGYNKIYYRNGSVLIHDDRIFMEYFTGNKWKQRGIPTHISWLKLTEYHYEVTRHYTDYLGTTFNVTYSVHTGYPIKITVNLDSGQTDEYRISWALSGITSGEYSPGINKAIFGDDGTDIQLAFDWSDAYQEFGDIATASVETQANGRKLTVSFQIGIVEEGHILTLDPTIIDYNDEGYSAGVGLSVVHPSSSAYSSAVSQSFTTPDNVYSLTSAKFQLLRYGSPTGNAYAKLYAHTGTYGTSSEPTGAVLATSNAFNIAGVTDVWPGSFYELTFSGGEQYEMQANTYYVIVFENPSSGNIDNDNYINACGDNSDGHDGNWARFYNSDWEYHSTRDWNFYVYGTIEVGEIPDWLNGWDYRKSHNIAGSTEGALTDYQVNITVNQGSGVDSEYTVYLNEKCLSDFGDIRFTAEDGTTELDYFLYESFQVYGETVVIDDGRGEYASPYVTRPAAWYFNGKTYFVYQDQSWDPNIVYYDHSTNTFSENVQIADSPIDDDHAYPTILIDSSGYIHVFYGCHISAMKYRKSSNPEDISSWDVMSDPYAEATYPQGIIRNSVMYVFFRIDDGHSYPYDMGFVTSDDGGASWSGVTNLITAGPSASAIYTIAVVLDSTGLIHMVWHRLVGVERVNMYHAYYDPDTAKCYSMDGTDLGASISEAEADTNCKLAVIATGSGFGDIIVDSDDYPLIVQYTYTPDIKSYHWNGSVWNIGTLTTDGFGVGSFAYYNDSDIRFFTDVTHGSYRDIREYKTTDLGSSWSKVTDITENDQELNYFPNVPENFDDDIKIFWGRGEETPCDIMAYGDEAGFSAYTVFWVEVDSIPADPSSATIYVYYGNADAVTSSSGPGTFPWLFDDFDDYSITDTPNVVDWDIQGTGGGDTITVQADPADATQKCFRIVESGDVTYTILAALFKDYRAGYAFHFRTRINEDIRYYCWGYEDGDLRTVVRRDFADDDFEYHDGDDYGVFVPGIASPINTWFETVEKTMDLGGSYLHWVVDGVDYAGGWYDSPTAGINIYDFHSDRSFAQTMYVGGTGTSDRYIFVRKFVDPEPVHGGWGEEEGIPGLSIINLSAEEWVFEGKTRYDFEVTYVNVTLSTVNQVGLRFTDSIGDVHTIWFDRAANRLTVTSPEDGISGWLQSIEQSEDDVLATFQIMFNTHIPDTYDIRAYGRIVTDSDTEWMATGGDIFNIYNLGGLSTLTKSGTAGRITGGDVFELYAADTRTKNIVPVQDFDVRAVPLPEGWQVLGVQIQEAGDEQILLEEVEGWKWWLSTRTENQTIHPTNRKPDGAGTNDLTYVSWPFGLKIKANPITSNGLIGEKEFWRKIEASDDEIVTVQVHAMTPQTTGTTGKILITDDGYVDDLNARVGLDSLQVVDLVFAGNGSMRLTDGVAGYIYPATYTGMTWYNFTFVINCTAQSYDMYVDEVLNATDVDFRQKVAGADSVGYITFMDIAMAGNFTEFYIDDLWVYTDFEADYGGYAEATMLFKHLQHWSMDFDFFVENGQVYAQGASNTPQRDWDDYPNYGYIELSWDVMLNETYVNDFLLAKITISDGHISGKNNWVKYNVTWYKRGVYIKNDLLYGLFEGYSLFPGDSKDTTGFHWDIWFNRANASTVVGARINTEFYGMSDKSVWWAVWSSNWKPMRTEVSESTVFINLEDADSTIHSAKDVLFVRSKVKVQRNTLAQFAYKVKNIQGLDFLVATDTMSGIDTPPIRDTVVPDVLSGFFGSALGSIFSAALKRLGNTLSGFGMGLFTLSIEFIDNIFAALGYPALVSTIFVWMDSLFASVPTLVGYGMTLIGQIFLLIQTSAGNTLNQLAGIITIWIGMYSTIMDLVTGVLTPGINLWNDLGINSFIRIGAVLYPFWLLMMGMDKGAQAVIDHLNGVLNIGSFFLNFILNIGGFFMGLLDTLIGAIRG